MSRPALGLLAGVLLVLPVTATGAAGINPHVDSRVMRGGCPSCHQTHGEPGSPMLPAPQRKLCLSCHGAAAEVNRRIRGGHVAEMSRPTSIQSALEQPFTHPIDEEAYSRHETKSVACTSCHSPHRGSGTWRDGSLSSERPRRPTRIPSTYGRRRSTRSPARFESELCEDCHGGESRRDWRVDLSDLLDPENPSYHPVKAPAAANSPSVVSEMSGVEINCTDCHGNDDPAGARGPHGSSVRHILRAGYTIDEGHDESEETYGLCYACHDRKAVLSGPTFPEHERHVVDLKISCAACHDPHGSTVNRSLIRFGGEVVVPGISASLSAGIVAFDSTLPGAGSCYLTCHGYDHGPAVYGGGGTGAHDKVRAEQLMRPEQRFRSPGSRPTGGRSKRNPRPRDE